jgi:hypothetical protein
MIYLSGCDCKEWRAYAGTDPIGVCNTPGINYTPKAMLAYQHWCADNACYAQGERFDLDAFLKWLAGLEPVQDRCLFAVAPDVIGDWQATLARSLPVVPPLRSLGYRAAVVLQDGATPESIPDCDAVFVGGTTKWKTSIAAERCCVAVKSLGIWVHMGRVNTVERLERAASMGCDSVDGTFVKFGPRVNSRKMIRWLRRVNAQQRMFAV